MSLVLWNDFGRLEGLGLPMGGPLNQVVGMSGGDAGEAHEQEREDLPTEKALSPSESGDVTSVDQSDKEQQSKAEVSEDTKTSPSPATS